MTDDFVMPRGRPPKPAHRVAHGTDQGYHWHRAQAKLDPTHETCPRCRKHWRDRWKEYRLKRDRQRGAMGAFLHHISQRHTNKHPEFKKDRAELERIVNKYATESQKREIFD